MQSLGHFNINIIFITFETEVRPLTKGQSQDQSYLQKKTVMSQKTLHNYTIHRNKTNMSTVTSMAVYYLYIIAS